MELIYKKVCPLALAPVLRHTVQHGIRDDQQPHCFQLPPQVHNVIDNDAVLRVHVRLMGKGVQTAGSEQLQRQRQITGFLLRLHQQLLPQNTQRRDRAAPLIGRIHGVHATVNDALLQRADAAPVQLLKEGQNKLGFVHHGIAAVAVALHHIHSVDMVGASRRNADDLAAKRLPQRIILPLRVADENIVLRGQRKERDQFLCRKGFAAAGDAGNNGGLVQQIGPVAQQQISGDCILSVIDAARLHDLLHPEGHQRRQRFRGEGTQNIQLLHTDGQRRIQSIHLLIFEHCHLAHLLTGQREDLVSIHVELFFGIGSQHHGQNAQHHALVTGRQIIQKLLAFPSLQLHIVGNDRRKVVVCVLTALPLGDIGLYAQQTVLDFPHCFIHRNRHDVQRKHHVAIQIGQFRNERVLDIVGIVLEVQYPAELTAQDKIVAVLLDEVRADIVSEIMAFAHHILCIKMEIRLLPLAIEVMEHTQLLRGIQLHTFRTQGRIMRFQVCSDTAKIASGFFDALFANGNRDVFFLHNSISSGSRCRNDAVILHAVAVPPVIPQRHQHVLLKACLVQATVINRDLCNQASLQTVQHLGIIQDHDLLILFTGHLIVNI